MTLIRRTRPAHTLLCALALAAATLPPHAAAQEAPDLTAGPAQSKPTPHPEPLQEQAPSNPPPQEPAAPPSIYDKAIFQKPIPPADLAFLKQFDGATSNELFRDKQFKKILKNILPGWMFHYGHDMSLPEAVDTAISGSPIPVHIRDGRYLTLAGRASLFPGLRGQSLLWFDLQDGLGLGAFYFHPSNGEPSPTVTVFSKQIKEDTITLGELPPAFAADLRAWSARSNLPPLTTRYFIGDLNQRILLEHDEDFCSYLPGLQGPPDDNCEQMNADSADLDMNTAYYLEQVHHATNATAWMITSDDETIWIKLRDRTCASGPDPVACHIRLTREHTHTIIRPHPSPTPHPPHK